MVREAGVEPARPEWTLEPESSESTNSTTRAFRNLSTARVSYHRTPALSTIIFEDRNIFLSGGFGLELSIKLCYNLHKRGVVSWKRSTANGI